MRQISSSKTIFGILMLLIVLMNFLNASDLQEQSIRKAMGLRPLSEQEKLEIAADLEKEEGEDLSDQELATASYYLGKDYSAMFVESMGYQGSTIILSDGSQWITNPSDGKKVQNWPDYYAAEAYGEHPAEVYVTSNNPWFWSEYKYKIVNKHTGKSARANISQSPVLSDTIYLVNLDVSKGIIELLDPNSSITTWSLSSLDKKVYSKWKINDRIIIGRNSKWNSSYSPYLFINIETLTHARGDLY